MLTENSALIFDTDLPAFVRAFFAFHTMSPMGALAIRQAGYVPELYGKVNGKPVKVLCAYSGYDVGIATEKEKYRRVLRTMISDFSLTPHSDFHFAEERKNSGC